MRSCDHWITECVLCSEAHVVRSANRRTGEMLRSSLCMSSRPKGMAPMKQQ